jgi:hypothetical protein
MKKMKLSSQLVGSPVGSHRAMIQWRDTMNYAAAISDNNPLYFIVRQEANQLSLKKFIAALLEWYFPTAR